MQESGSQTNPSSADDLASFIVTREREILELWSAEVRKLPAARKLDDPALIDHIPELLRRVAKIATELATGKDAPPPNDDTTEHAIDRLEAGFDLEQVVLEFSTLRDCMLLLWEQGASASWKRVGARILHRAIDLAISASVERYTYAQNRTLQALDRFSELALGSRDLDELLDKLLHVLMETVPTIDTATILLREGDRLFVRATIGLEEALEQNFSLRIGEGFAGAIAAERKPKRLRANSGSPLLESPVARARDLRALYGVPLLDDGEVVGVAHIGSLTAYDFSEQDSRLFAAMAARATTAVAQHLLRETADGRMARLQQLERLLSVHPDFFYLLDADHRFSYVSPSLLRLWGRTLDTTLGKTFAELDYPPHLVELHALQLDRALAGETVQGENSYIDRFGRSHLYEYTFVPVRAQSGRVVAIAGVTHDVTERRQNEQMARFLGQASEIFASSLDHRQTLRQVAELAAYRLGDLCLVDLVKPGDQLERVAMAGTSAAKLDRIRELDHYEPLGVESMIGALQAVRAGTPLLFSEVKPEMYARVARSAPQRALLRELDLHSAMSVPIVAHGSVLGVMTFLSTRADRSFSHADLVHARELARRAALAAENAGLYEQARQATHLREELLAVVSHDLRNPLGTISMSAGVLRRHTAGDERSEKAIDTIVRATGRMDRLIGNLLDLASIHSGHLSVDRALYAADALVREAIEQHLALAQEKGLQLDDAGDAQGALVLADHDRVQQVLGNLIGNALKFCREGDEVTVRTTRRNGDVLFAVEDTGPGIAPDELPRVFESHWSGRHGPSRSTGLGLYICKNIVESHGGHIWVESEELVGTTFYFTLPCARSDARGA